MLRKHRGLRYGLLTTTDALDHRYRCHRSTTCTREIDRPVTNASVAPPAITKTAGLEDSYVDLTFAIEQPTTDPGVGQQLVAIGRDGDRNVGFRVLLKPDWAAAKFEGLDLETYRGTVEIESIGPRSDGLISAIDRLYRTSIGAKSMARSTRFVGIFLQGNPTQLDKGPVKIKLFLESEVEVAYAEAFLNVDVRAGSIELNEKDPDYRGALVRALAGM